MVSLLRDVAARELLDQQTTQGSASVTFADLDIPVLVAVIPAGSLMLPPITGAQVNTPFDAVTTNTIVFGDGVSAALFGTVDTTAAGFVPVALASAVYSITVRTEVYATVRETGGTLTAGAANVVVQWVTLPA